MVRKTVSVSSANLSRFSTGQIINFMSTDTDRSIYVYCTLTQSGLFMSTVH